MSHARPNAPEYDADDILEGIRDWVFIESPTDFPEGVNHVMDLAEREMVSLGAAVEREPGGEGYADLLTARIPGTSEGPGILVLGHLDTVHAVGTLARELPFRREGDRVSRRWSRGRACSRACWRRSRRPRRGPDAPAPLQTAS